MLVTLSILRLIFGITGMATNAEMAYTFIRFAAAKMAELSEERLGQSRSFLLDEVSIVS